jgi:cytochrome c553
MSKYGILVSIVAIIGALSIASLTASADASAPCVRKDFKTDLVKQACTSGGQQAAKDAMKKWNKDHNITSCNKCHSKLAPTYELKDDGLDQFTKLGGK